MCMVKLNELKQYKFIDKKSFYSRKKLLNHLEANIPNILLVSGRMDKDYLFVTKKIKCKMHYCICSRYYLFK